MPQAPPISQTAFDNRSRRRERRIRTGLRRRLTTKRPGTNRAFESKLTQQGRSHPIPRGRSMSMAGIWFLHGKRNPRQPKARRAAHARLIRMLAHDGQHRRPPPVTLPGPRNGSTLSEMPGPEASPAPPLPYRTPGRWSQIRVVPRAHAGEHAKATNNDGKGPYSRHQLWRMNARFIARVERAFADGAESRAAASASVIRRPPTP